MFSSAGWVVVMGMEGRQDYDTALHQLVTVTLVIGVSKAMAKLNCVDCLL